MSASPADDPLGAEGRLEPELDWSAFEPGRRFPAVPLALDDAQVDAYLEATGESHPLYERGGLAPPLMSTMVRLVKASLGGRWPSGTVQLDHRIAMHRALRRGERLWIDARVTRAWQRNGRSYYELVSELCDGEGARVGLQSSTSMWAGALAPGTRTAGPGLDGGAREVKPAAQAPALEAPALTALGPLQQAYPLTALRAFGRVAGALDPIHVDEAFGRGTRWGVNIAQGRLVMTLLSRLLLARHGRRFLDGHDLQVRFVAPVPVGMSVTARGWLQDIDPCDLVLRCDDPSGRPVITGRVRLGEPSGRWPDDH